MPHCFNCPDYTAFPGTVNQPGATGAGTGTIQPSAAAPMSPASSGAAPAGGGGAPIGESGELTDGSVSGWGAVGYGVANGPAIFNAARTWAKAAEYQENTYQPVAMSRTAAAVDGAVPNYGSSPVGLGSSPDEEGSQLDDRSRYAGIQYDINRALNEGDYKYAFEVGRRFWGIDPNIPIQYEPNLVDEKGRYAYGETIYDHPVGVQRILIGAPGVSDAGALLATLFHEGGASLSSHVAQAGPPTNWADPDRVAARAVNELQPSLAERRIAGKLGLHEGHVKAIDNTIWGTRAVIRGTPYGARVRAGNFKLFPSDLITR